MLRRYTHLKAEQLHALAATLRPGERNLAAPEIATNAA
jgi:hypothetical protein